MIVAYLTALYPKTSHSFVRREIAALEKLGFEVLRYSTRRVQEPLVDPDDIAERERTRALLDAGAAGILASTCALAIRRPVRWFGALRAALKLARGSDSGALRHLVYFGEACVLVRSLERSGAQHLHAHFATNATTIAMLSHLLGGPPYSFTAHGTDAQDHMPLSALGQKVRHARFVAAVSQHARAHLMRFSAPGDWPRIHVVRCGLDAGFLEQQKVPMPQQPRLLCVARFDVEKGLLGLLDAASVLAREGRAFELELVGDGPLRPEIEHAIERLGLGKHVVLAGWLGSAEVRARLLASRILVLPSFAEGLPVVLMEALSVGRPVIATAVGGIPELVVDGENGWLVAPASVEALARALLAALDTPLEELERMGSRGRASVLERHDALRETARLAALFEGEPRER